MIDPTFPLAFALYAAKQVNEYTDGWAVDVTKGVLGNFAHGLLGKSAKRALTIIKSRNEESYGNHDLMKALRRSMLDATGQIPVEKEEKEFQHWLQKWLNQQLKQLNDLDSWHDWNNSAIGELELFFDKATNYPEHKQQLIQKMTEDWSQYLQTQETLLPIPEAFILKICNGWQEQNHKITWWGLVMETFKNYVRSGKTPEAQQAEKALVHNFLAELKMEMKEMGEEIKQIQPQLQEMMDLMKKTHPSSSQVIDEEWKQIMASLVEANKNLTETVKSQEESNSFLIKILDEKERKIITLPDIQEVLKKKEKFEGEFFRKEPAWVDYKNGFIVERKEVDDIIKKLENNKVQLVLGAPASGKSIILKNVGYKFANENKKVYVVELKKHPQDEIKLFFENIPKMNYVNSIIIVDDAHLYLSECERLIRNFRSKGKGNLIIGSRETREITEEHPKEAAEYELLSQLSATCIHIQAEDVTEELIRTFLEKQFRFDKVKIKIISSNIDIYKNDLWLLSWALKTYNKDKKSVDIDEIYEKIASSIEEIRVGKDKEPINAEDVLLPLSIFYRYEIPIERYFLEEQLGIDGNIINQLIGLQEIMQIKKFGHKMLSLHHSSIADLYFGAYRRYPDLGKSIKKKILNGKDEEDLEYCLFYRYMTTTDPRNAVDVIIHLGEDYLEKRKTLIKKLYGVDVIIHLGEDYDDKKRKTLINKLSKDDIIQKSIEKGIEKENIKKIERCLSHIGLVNKDVEAKLVESIDLNVLSSKIDMEGDIRTITNCVNVIASANKDIGMKLVESIDLDVLSSKLMWRRENIYESLGFLDCIRSANKDVGYNLVNNIDFHILSSVLDDVLFPLTMFYPMMIISYANEDVGLKLVDCISLRLIKEMNLHDITTFVFNVAKANNKVGLKLVESIGLDVLSSKIDMEDDIQIINYCVEFISWVNKDIVVKLVNCIDIDALSSKINKEADIGKVASCVSNIGLANIGVGLKLFDSTNVDAWSSKIDKEEDIGKVGSCVSDISRINKEIALKLCDNIDIEALSLKIDEEEDIEKVGSCVARIANASKEVAMKLTDSVSARINNEEDIEKVGSCVSGISRINKEIALKLCDDIDIEALSLKIDEEEDIEKVGLCVEGIANASKEMAMKLAESVSARINREVDMGKVGSCVEGIANASKEMAMKLAESVSARINKEVDIEKVGWCISDIGDASKEVANEIINRLKPKLRERVQKWMV